MDSHIVISPSLLENVTIKPVPKRFSLEPHLFCDTPRNSEPKPKKTKVERFSTLTSEALQKLSKPHIPKKTEASTKWAVDNFNSWLQHKNSTSAGEKCPENLLVDMEPCLLNKWLSVYMYIAETRKTNGENYPPSALQSLLSGILRHNYAEY